MSVNLTILAMRAGNAAANLLEPETAMVYAATLARELKAPDQEAFIHTFTMGYNGRKG